MEGIWLLRYSDKGGGAYIGPTRCHGKTASAVKIPGIKCGTVLSPLRRSMGIKWGEVTEGTKDHEVSKAPCDSGTTSVESGSSRRPPEGVLQSPVDGAGTARRRFRGWEVTPLDPAELQFRTPHVSRQTWIRFYVDSLRHENFEIDK